jgi:DNA replication licensing factor MCM7
MRESGAAAVGDGEEGELSMRRIRERVLAKGFTDDQLTMAIDEYEELNVRVVSLNTPRRLLLISLLLCRFGKSLTTELASFSWISAVMRQWTCNS